VLDPSPSMFRFECAAHCGTLFVFCFGQTVISPLKWQTRAIAVFPNADGFALGSIEGRVAIQYVVFVYSTIVRHYWDYLGLTFCGSHRHLRNIDEKDQE
jgi:hypothetical protein